MVELFNVRKPSGRLCAQCLSREHADREIGWQLASGIRGPFVIERFDREPSWGYDIGAPARFAARWPSAKLAEFHARYASREPVNDIAEYFGTNVVIVCRIARRLGFGQRIDDPATFEQHRGRWTDREDQLVNLMYDEGIGVTKIPDHHPRTQGAVTQRLRDTAPRISTRSKFGRFIRRGRRTIHRILEEAGESTVHREALRDKVLAAEIQGHTAANR